MLPYKLLLAVVFIRSAELSQDTVERQTSKGQNPLWDPELPERALYELPTWDLKISSTSMAPDLTDETTATTLLIKPFKRWMPKAFFLQPHRLCLPH